MGCEQGFGFMKYNPLHMKYNPLHIGKFQLDLPSVED